MTAPLPRLALSDQDDDFRAAHVGASEVAALFDCHPWLTRYELWHRKRGNIATPDFAENERMQWGSLLEPVILDEACRRFGWEPIETPQRLSNGRGLGGHPDRIVRFQDGRCGPVEAKAVDWLQFKKWGEEPELHYLLQPQTYTGLGKYDRCAIVALVGGNQLEKWEFDFRSNLYAEIERRTDDFWSSIRANDPPRPDFARDGDTLLEVLGEPTDEVIDLRRDNEADHLAVEWLAARDDRDTAIQRMNEAKTALLLKIGDAGRALLPSHRITAGKTKDTPDRPAEPGEIIKGRRGYRQFLLKEAN